MGKEDWPKETTETKDKKKMLRETAAKIENYIAENGLIEGYLRRNGYKNIQSVPEAIVSRARTRWEHFKADALLATPCSLDECEQDPITCLEFARALKREAEEK